MREAHAQELPKGNARPDAESAAKRDAETLAERRRQAQGFAESFNVAVPILVDDVKDSVATAYQAQPDRLYVIDAAGKIAHVGRPGPQGFRIIEVPRVLDKLLDVSFADELQSRDEEQWHGHPLPFAMPPMPH